MSSNIENYILNDQVETAATLINSVLGGSKNVEVVALQVLKVLSSALAKCLRNKHVCKSKCKHIFKIADACCKALSKTWKCRQTVFLQCLYYVCKYFITKNDYVYAKQLCLYLFELKKNRSGIIWNEDEKSVLNTMLKDFINCWFNESNPDVFGSGDLSVTSQWTFIYSMSELNNHDNIFLMIHAASKLLSKILDVSLTHRLGCQIFKQFCAQVPNKSITLETQSDFNSLILMVDSYFWSMQHEHFVYFNHEDLILFLKTVDFRILSNKSSFIKSVIKLIPIFRDIELSDLENVTVDIENVSKCKELNNFTLKIVFSLLQVLSTKKKLIGGEIVLKLITVVKYVSTNIKSDVKKTATQDNTVSKIVILAMKVIANCEEEKTQLEKFYEPVFRIIQIYFANKNSKSYLDSAVYLFTKLIMSLFKVGLHFESMQLARILLTNLREVEITSEPSAQLKTNVNCILQTFVKSSATVNISFEVLLYLLALSEESNPLFYNADKFKYWCQLKLHPNDNKVKEITVYNIINIDCDRVLDKSVVDDMLKWPFSTVACLNYEHLLLLEIQAYLKHKDLMDSALAVYKAAVANVKCKFTLARIVCCATRAVMENSAELVTIKKFHQSIHNMIKIISKSQQGELDEIEKTLVLGDLYYCLARCLITIQRKIDQTQVVNMYPKDPLIIPVPEDPLNSTVVLNEFSFIAYQTQDEVVANLAQAYEAWNQALAMLRKTKEEKMEEYNFGVICSLKYIKENGYLHRLYRDVKRENLVWQLLYDISTMFNLPKYRIQAFSELLCILVHVDEEVVCEMKAYVSSQPDIESTYYFYLFHIALGRNNLYNQKVDDESKVELDESKMKSWNYVQAQYSLYCYLLHCAQGVKDLKASRKLIKAFELSLKQSNVPTNSFVLETIAYCLLFDIALMIGRLFCKAKDVRNARFYSSKQLEMSQQLHLPIRTCELLALQAEIDLISANSADLTNKLSGVETILGLSHKGVKYDIHKAECKCAPCAHIEYQIAFAFTILLKTGLYMLQQASTDCLESLKDCREVLSKLKKKLNRNYVTEYLDCDISFNKMAVEVLRGWGKIDKVSKYSEHALSYIKRNYKPCSSELSTLNINSLNIIINFPNLTSSAVYNLTEDEQVDSNTPLTALEIRSPPPIGWKNFTSIPGDNDELEPKNKITYKKLVFDVQSDDSENSDRILKTPYAADRGKKIDLEKTDTENQHNLVTSIKNKKGQATLNVIPSIKVTTVDDDVETSSPVLNKVQDQFIKPPGTSRRLNHLKKNNFVTPVKTLVAVFCDDEGTNKATKSRRKRVQRKINVDTKPISIITIDSDEDLELIDTGKTKQENINKIVEFTPIQREKMITCKNLFTTEDSDKDSCTSDALNFTCLPQDEAKAISSSSDENSIINATVYEEAVNSTKFQLTSTPQMSGLEDKLSKLCVTPTSTSPLARPLQTTTVKKYTRKPKVKPDTVSRKPNRQISTLIDIEPVNINRMNLLSLDDQSQSTPVTARKTRSSRRLLLSTTKVNRL